MLFAVNILLDKTMEFFQINLLNCTVNTDYGMILQSTKQSSVISFL